MPDRSGEDFLVVRNRSASGGVNTFSFPLDIRDDQLVDMTNGIATTPGIREVRPGSSIVATGITFGPILALQEFMYGGVTAELLAISPGATFPNAGNLKLWKWNGTGTQFTLVGTLTGFTTATAPVDIIAGVDLNAGTLYSRSAVVRIASRAPVDNGFIYSGDGLTMVTGPGFMPTTGMFPIGNVLSRGFGGGQQGSRVGVGFYSDVAAFAVTGWGVIQNFALGGGNRQQIVVIKPFRATTVFFGMSDRLEALILDGDPIAVGGALGNTLWRREVIDTRIGVSSRLSVQTVGEDLFFCDQYSNIRSLNQTITDNNQGIKRLPVSAPIQSWIDRVNPAAVDKIAAASYDRYYVVAFPIDLADVPNYTFVYDTINQAWYGPWDGNFATVNVMAVATLNFATLATDKNPTLYLGGSATARGEVRRSFVGTTDDGSPINYQETSKRYDYGGIEAAKQPRRLRTYVTAAPGATMLVEGRQDGTDWKTIGYIDLSGQSPRLPLTLPFNLLGTGGVVEDVFTLEDIFELPKDMQYRMTCTASQAVQVLGHTAQVHLKNIDWTPT